jgi:molecular chaperone GrpE
MTQGSMKKVFTKHGLVQIQPAEGEKFDPNLHEALFTQPAEGKTANTVSTVTKVGYQLRGRTLRPAIVGVYTS